MHSDRRFRFFTLFGFFLFVPHSLHSDRCSGWQFSLLQHSARRSGWHLSLLQHSDWRSGCHFSPFSIATGVVDGTSSLFSIAAGVWSHFHSYFLKRDCYFSAFSAFWKGLFDDLFRVPDFLLHSVGVLEFISPPPPPHFSTCRPACSRSQYRNNLAFSVFSDFQLHRNGA